MGILSKMCKKWKLVCLSGLLGIGYYIADACVDAYLFHEGKLIDQFLHPEPIELWMWFGVIFVSLLFGVFVQFMVHRADAATEQARTAEKFLNSVIENIPNMIFIKDAEHLRFTRINKAGEELLGHSRDRLIGKNDFDFFPREQAEYFTGKDRLVLQSGAAMDIPEEDIASRDGGIRVLHTRKVPILDEQGNPEFLLGISEDVTARKHAENQLRLAGVVFMSSKQGVVVTDSNNRIVSVNPAYTAITGYTQEEVFGKDPSYIKSGRYDNVFYQKLWSEIEECGYWEGELWNRRKNGEAFPAWQSISAVFDPGHELIHYVSVFSDMTPLKEHQMELDYLVHHDPLTGLPNRLMFDDRLTHALQRCVREGTELALLFMDLDDFKNINDTYGHATGDYLLQTVSKRLEALLRKEDTIARFGGDEFLILLESFESIAGIEAVTKKIMDEISTPLETDAGDIAACASVGIAVGPRDGSNGPDLIKAGDVAMYRAKADGPGNYCFSTRVAE